MFIFTSMPDCSLNSAKSASLTATSCRWFDIHVTVVPSNGLSWANERRTPCPANAAAPAAPAAPFSTPRRLSEFPDNGDLNIQTLLVLISERRGNTRDADGKPQWRAEGGPRRPARSVAQ